jgi:hypothetical protein
MTRKTWAVAAAGLCASGACAQQLPANVRCVRNGAPAGGDGRSWAAAWPELQEALLTAAASGGQITEVWVAQGTYSPPVWNACAGFPVSNVSLYGGFAGTETSLSQRPTGTTTDLRPTTGSCPLGGVLLNINTVQPVWIDGLVVLTGGYSTAIGVAGPCTLRNVASTSGGRLIVKTDNSPITIQSCSFDFLYGKTETPVEIAGPGLIEGSFLHGSPYFGIGVRLSNITVRDSSVYAYTESGGISASGVVFDKSFVRGRVKTSGVAFVGTDVQFNDSRIDCNGYDGVLMSGGSIRRSVVIARGDSWAGAGLIINGTVLNDTVVDSQGASCVRLRGPVIALDCRFFGGGRFGISGGAEGMPRFVNCLFQHSGWDPAMFEVGPQWRFDNCIIWGYGSDDASTFNAPAGMTGFVNYCDVRGWSGALGGVGNISVDPLLNTDGTLRFGSPCIDAGDNARVPPGAVYDFVRGCRIVDGDVNGSRVVDMGPHEFTLCAANCDCSTGAPVLNVLDFNCFLHRFSVGDPWANCDRSTEPPVLNVLDFTCFVQRFTAGCP